MGGKGAEDDAAAPPAAEQAESKAAEQAAPKASDHEDPATEEQVEPEKGSEAAKATSGTCGNNATWSMDGEGTVTISGTGAMNNYYSSSDFTGPWPTKEVKKVIIKEGISFEADKY